MPNDLTAQAPTDSAGNLFAGAVNPTEAVMRPIEGGTQTAITGSPTGQKVNRLVFETKDGGINTIGAQADAAASSDTATATLMALFKRLLGKFGPIGQNTKAQSVSVTVASDQGNLAISGTVTANAGTNLNTSLLALESGGHLATVDSSTAAINTTTGATTDAAVTGDNAGSLSSKLRGLSKILNDVWDSVNHRLHVNVDAGSITANAGTNLNTSALALESGGNLASVATNTAHNNPAGSNTTLSSPPANTNAAADTALTFTSAVNHWTLQNASNQTIYYALDASTTVANTPIYTLMPGSQVWWDWPVTVVHVYTTTAISFNGAIGALGLTLIGRA